MVKIFPFHEVCLPKWAKIMNFKMPRRHGKYHVQLFKYEVQQTFVEVKIFEIEFNQIKFFVHYVNFLIIYPLYCSDVLPVAIN